MPYADPRRQRAYQRRWYRRRRERFFADKCCQWCGSTESLELHHADPEAKETHRIWSWSRKRREAELGKCIVVCRQCHQEYHAEEQRMPIVHGTNAGYDKGCRCNACRAAHAERMRDYRRRKKIERQTGVLPAPSY